MHNVLCFIGVVFFAACSIGCLYLAAYLLGPAPYMWYSGVNFLLSVLGCFGFVAASIACVAKWDGLI